MVDKCNITVGMYVFPIRSYLSVVCVENTNNVGDKVEIDLLYFMVKMIFKNFP